MRKFNDAAPNEIAVFVYCLRIPQLNTDVVLSLNSPTFIAQDSSSANQLDQSKAALHTTIEAATAEFASISSTLTIQNFSIFSS